MNNKLLSCMAPELLNNGLALMFSIIHKQALSAIPITVLNPLEDAWLMQLGSSSSHLVYLVTAGRPFGYIRAICEGKLAIPYVKSGGGTDINVMLA